VLPGRGRQSGRAAERPGVEWVSGTVLRRSGERSLRSSAPAGGPARAAAVETVEVDAAGVAAGVFATSSYVGRVVGSMALAALLAGTADDSAGFPGVFLMVLVASLLSVVTSLGPGHGPS
jgi:hypothetical protein